MLIIVVMLLVFRLPELRECWKIHRRIRFYFGLTVIAITVNLAVGIGGLLHLAWKRKTILYAISWGMRNIHIALDTLVLYSVLGVTSSGGGVDGLMRTSRGSSARVMVSMFSGHELSTHGQRGDLSSEQKTSSVARW